MRDLIAHPDAALEVCRHRALRGEEGCSVEAFPHPKRKGQVRWFTCADPFDELPVRITVDEIARVADAGVSPQAFGYRLHPKPPHQVWQYKHLGRAHKRLRKESTRSIRSKSFECLVITDLRGFYHSVDVAALTGLLVGGGCHPVAVATLRDELDSFSGRSSLPGMPIGLEAGGLLANVYLTPADRALAIEGLNFVHWGDDYFFFLTKADTVENTMLVLAEQGRGLGFSIADDKTDIIWDPEKAQQRVRDRMLSYAEVALDADRAVGLDMMQDILEEEAASDDPREARVRFAIRAMTNCSDPRGLAVLARHQNLLAVDPRTIADYIRALTITDARHGEPFFEVLDQPARDRNDGVIAHVLRALDCRGWGHAEGDRFDRIARDSARRTYVRGWALQGFSRCPQWRPDDVVDLVRSRDAHPRLVRAGGLAIRHVPESRARTQMLRLMSTAKPELVPTAEWIASAP